MGDMSVEEVFLDVGREIGRGPNEMEPFIQKVVRDNFLDTIESLLKCTDNGNDDTKLFRMGVPQRVCDVLLEKLRATPAGPPALDSSVQDEAAEEAHRQREAEEEAALRAAEQAEQFEEEARRQREADAAAQRAIATRVRTEDPQQRVYLLKYSHAPQPWIDALERDAELQRCRAELQREYWHVQELLGGTFVKITDPCTLDARVLAFETMDRPPKIFVRPAGLYRGLMDLLWKDSLTPLVIQGGTGTGTFRQDLSNRHIFVSEDMLREVKRIEAQLPLELPELPREVLNADVDRVQARRPREGGQQTWEIDRFELRVSSVNLSFPSDRTAFMSS